MFLKVGCQMAAQQKRAIVVARFESLTDSCIKLRAKLKVATRIMEMTY